MVVFEHALLGSADITRPTTRTATKSCDFIQNLLLGSNGTEDIQKPAPPKFIPKRKILGAGVSKVGPILPFARYLSGILDESELPVTPIRAACPTLKCGTFSAQSSNPN